MLLRPFVERKKNVFSLKMKSDLIKPRHLKLFKSLDLFVESKSLLLNKYTLKELGNTEWYYFFCKTHLLRRRNNLEKLKTAN